MSTERDRSRSTLCRLSGIIPQAYGECQFELCAGCFQDCEAIEFSSTWQARWRAHPLCQTVPIYHDSVRRGICRGTSGPAQRWWCQRFDRV